MTYKKLPKKRRYYVCEIKGCGKKALYYDSQLEFNILGFTEKTWTQVSQTNDLMFLCEEHHHG